MKRRADPAPQQLFLLKNHWEGGIRVFTTGVPVDPLTGKEAKRDKYYRYVKTDLTKDIFEQVLDLFEPGPV